MTVQEFIDGYNAANNKEKYIEKHIVNKYVPYEEKCLDCKNIIESTSFITIGDNKVFKRDTPATRLFFDLTLVDKYTDVDINYKNPASEYNLLQESGVNVLINAMIPEMEFITYNNLLSMTIDDFMENNRSIVSKIDVIEMIIRKLYDSSEKE